MVHWRIMLRPRWLAWHVFVVLVTAGMIWLGDWQLHRALSGNSLSWAYTFEWPLFAIFAVVFWGKTIREEARPPARAKPTGDEELAPYNAYLARLTKEVKGHGRWHGLR